METPPSTGGNPRVALDWRKQYAPANAFWQASGRPFCRSHETGRSTQADQTSRSETLAGIEHPENIVGRFAGGVMDFFEQYKHPLWQKKRLEVLQAADFLCERCCDAESPLHVHHKRYVKGRKVWDYDKSELVVLCDTCHETAHAEKENIQSLIALIPLDSIHEIASLVANYCAIAEGPLQGVDFDEQIASTQSEPIAAAVGKVAATLSNRCSVDDIRDFSEKLSSSEPGAVVDIPIKRRKVLYGIEF